MEKRSLRKAEVDCLETFKISWKMPLDGELKANKKTVGLASEERMLMSTIKRRQMQDMFLWRLVSKNGAGGKMKGRLNLSLEWVAKNYRPILYELATDLMS